MLGRKDKEAPEIKSEEAPQVEVRTDRSSVSEVREMLKQLSPASKDNAVPINQISAHCGKILTMALNLEWFGHTGGKQSPNAEKPANIIAVRILDLDISLAEFFERIKGILHRIEN